MKKIFFFLLVSAISITASFVAPDIALAGPYDYTLLEPLTAETTTGDFPTYVQSIYKFAIWTIGIAALLMLSIGGFMYMTSAGNNASAESAKRVIKDALFGLIVALLGWLLLNTINPDLISGDLSSITELKVEPPERTEVKVNQKYCGISDASGGDDTISCAPTSLESCEKDYKSCGPAEEVLKDKWCKKSAPTNVPLYKCFDSKKACDISQAGVCQSGEAISYDWSKEEEENRARLKDSGIGVNKNAASGAEGTTKLAGLTEKSLVGLEQLASACGNCSDIEGQNLTVTGGTERGHNEDGHHPDGEAVDLAVNENLSNYIIENGEKDESENGMAGKFQYYIITEGPLTGTRFLDERTADDQPHWHAEFL